MDEIVLKVEKLNVKFDGHKILDNISFTVRKDTTLAIIGPNGAGKTVLFKSILGLSDYEGSVEWADGVRIGYVPQKLSVGRDLPLTVEEFLKLKESDIKRIKSTLEEVGLGDVEGEEPHRGRRLLKSRMGVLSGGELQRVLIVFALLGSPDVLLFDEPTAGVDISAEETVYALMDKLKREKNLTIIFISHELEIVYKYADDVLCLNREKLCFGPPRKVINKGKLDELYGEEVHIYEHEEHGHHHKHHG